MKYSVCIEMLFHEAMFEDRIRLAKEAGFSAVEFWCWWEHDMEAITGVCRSEGMLISNICTRFIPLTDLGQADDYIAGLIETLEAAKRLGCLNICLLYTSLIVDGFNSRIVYKIKQQTSHDCFPMPANSISHRINIWHQFISKTDKLVDSIIKDTSLFSKIPYFSEYLFHGNGRSGEMSPSPASGYITHVKLVRTREYNGITELIYDCR